MPPHSPLTIRVAAKALACLALSGLPLAACDAGAQRQPSAASTEGEDYRLTMPTLHKALPVLYAAEAEEECRRPGEEGRDVRAMSIAEMEQRLEGCPPIRRGAAEQGISLRELALIFNAIMLTSHRLAQEEGAKATGGAAPPLPPGALRDNVALWRQNEADIARLSGHSK
ncbi:MAG TPA: hypothetical protein VF061_00385 [Gemmatimonadales bacterium]